MRTVDKQWTENHHDEFITAMKNGDIIIYPTDTIYGIGCNALNTESVQRLRDLKQRPDKPFSIIAPAKEWVKEHFFIPSEALSLLPGPVTLFLEPKVSGIFPHEINPGGTSIGVRIPDHWFSDLVTAADIPFVTTSVNISDQPHMTRLEDIPPSFHTTVAFCVYEGPIEGTSSTKFDFTQHTT